MNSFVPTWTGRRSGGRGGLGREKSTQALLMFFIQEALGKLIVSFVSPRYHDLVQIQFSHNFSENGLL